MPGTIIIQRSALLFCLGLLLAACEPNATPPPAVVEEQATTNSQMIPRSVLMQPALQYQGRISPNGRKVSWLSLVDGALNLFVADSDKPDTAIQVTAGPLEIGIHYWTPNSAYILYTRFDSTKKQATTYAYNITTKETRRLGPEQAGVRVKLEKVSANWPNAVLVSINERDLEYADLYRFDLSTGSKKLLKKNPGYQRWVADDELTPRIGIKTRNDGSNHWYFLLPDGTDKLIFKVASKDARTTRPLRFDPSGTTLYMLDSRGLPHARLVSIDLLQGQSTILGEQPGFSVDQVLFHPVTGMPLAWSYYSDTLHWVALERGFRPSLELARKALGPHFRILSTTSSLDRLVAYSDRNDRPGKYSIIEPSIGKVTTMFETAPEEMVPVVSTTRLVHIPARDGFELSGFFTPARQAPAESPVASPMVIMASQWPGARFVYGYDPQIPWLSSRGYSVLELNTRGSGSLGWAYEKYANANGLLLAASDMNAAAIWAVDNGYTDGHNIAAMGAGFGGSTALNALKGETSMFSCAVALDPVIDLAVTLQWLREKNPEEARQLEAKLKGRDVKPGPDSLAALSPVSNYQSIQKPVLALHSDRVMRESLPRMTEFAQKLAEQGTEISLALMKGKFEVWYENKVVPPALPIVEHFLGNCLGGAVEPVGNDFDDIEIRMPVGSKHMPGLASAFTPE